MNGARRSGRRTTRPNQISDPPSVPRLAYAQRELIGQSALKTRLPAVVFMRETLVPGTLLSYGVDSLAICRRAAAYVDKILKGAKPGELPVEQPTKFELLINLKTAKALGITVPPPEEERKWALYLACVLGVMMMVGIGAVVLLFKFAA